MGGPNPIVVARSIARVLWRVKRPSWNQRDGHVEHVDHRRLADVLSSLVQIGPTGLASVSGDLTTYLAEMSAVDPDGLPRSAALAYWVNVYNAGALQLASRADQQGLTTVLRVPGGFGAPFITVGGERLSLDGVEHGKVRRFGDPRVHGALVCGSVSCPTLRATPYMADDLDGQLDGQMRSFLAGGGAVRRGDALSLSRVFRWFGGDFARPAAMPTWIPASKRRLVRAITPYFQAELRDWVTVAQPRVQYQPYDWGLRCSVN